MKSILPAVAVHAIAGSPPGTQRRVAFVATCAGRQDLIHPAGSLAAEF
jgi:hypothetical protein